jgi:hypothetical protein
VATFTGLQPHFVVGAGYRLRFIFNPSDKSAFNAASAHTAANGISQTLNPKP